MFRIVVLLVILPTLALAQAPSKYAAGGVAATAAHARIERDGPRPYTPRGEAAAMPAAAAMEYFPGLKLPGEKEEFRRPAPAIRIVKPAYRVPETDFGIGDVQDVVFLGEKRLVRFRFHLRATGQSLTQRWKGELRKYFDFLDRDGSGDLNRHETEFAFTNAGVVQMLRTGSAYQRADDPSRFFADMDQDRDERVGFDEFAAFYAPSASRIIAAQFNPNRDPTADSLTDSLIKALDADKDGKLSREELTTAEKLLTTLDLNEDECLSYTEVLPSTGNLRQAARPVTPAVISPTSMFAFPPGGVPESFAQTILSRYDRDKNLKLDRSENPFDESYFKQIDRNGDGELVVAELARWKDLPPDLELELTLGDQPEKNVIKALERKEPTPLAGHLKPSLPGTAIVSVGSQSVQISCYAPTGVYSSTARMNVFPFSDGGKGHITEDQLAGPQFQAIRLLFDTIDRDGDGKMTLAEYNAFFNFQRDFTRLPLTLVYSAQTPSLFQVLDTSGDGRLGVRELRDAWAKLSALEPESKTHVTRAALMPQGAIRFGRANDVFVQNQVPNYMQQGVRQSVNGPLWFRKFDRNGDGELSRGEFPGSVEEFDRIDINRDGFISLEEAVAADKKLRVKK